MADSLLGRPKGLTKARNPLGSIPEYGQPDYLLQALGMGLFIRRSPTEYPPGRLRRLLARASLARGAALVTLLD